MCGSVSIMKYAIIIPTLNAGIFWRRSVTAIKNQLPTPHCVLVIDSGSTDDTVSVSKAAGFDVCEIPEYSFDHGGTRQMGVDGIESVEFVVLLTQDAVLKAVDSIHNLLRSFDDKQVGAAYGRQIPRPGASPIESHARKFNYGDLGCLKSKQDIPQLGLKTAFCSNSFSAWRRESLLSVGGFPKDMIFAEDMYTAAKLILADKKIAYVADAECEHSHNYTVKEEFQRAFDIGVFHEREKWLIRTFGKAEGEGKRFVFSELKYVLRENALYMPLVLLKTTTKMLGYFLGRHERHFGLSTKRTLSQNKGFWSRASEGHKD